MDTIQTMEKDNPSEIEETIDRQQEMLMHYYHLIISHIQNSDHCIGFIDVHKENKVIKCLKYEILTLNLCDSYTEEDSIIFDYLVDNLVILMYDIYNDSNQVVLYPVLEIDE